MDQRHFIQRHILGVLMDTKYARFRDMRPDDVDSNAYSYHLTALQKEKLVQKTSEGYTLSIRGLSYIDILSSHDKRPRSQPKIMTLIMIENEYGHFAAYQKERQPFIGQLTFPSGKLHMDDISIKQAALREVREKTGGLLTDLRHVGDSYIALTHDHQVIMNALMHVFYIRIQMSSLHFHPEVQWYTRDEIMDKAAPATRRVVQLMSESFDSHRFFDEYSELLP